MLRTILRDRGFYEEHYEKLGKSISQIAEEIGVYTNKIRRELKYYGFELRNRSDSQKNALLHERSSHPTKGRKRSVEERERISNAVAARWKDISDEERERRIKQGQERWANMPADQRETLTQLATTAIREAATNGSKLEHFLSEEIGKTGVDVQFHRQELIPNEKLEVDLFVPAANLAIEIDGPSHFLPVWGEIRLKKTILADDKKNQLLLSYGITVLRLRYSAKHTSDALMRSIFQKIMSYINSLLIEPNELAELILVEVE